MVIQELTLEGCSPEKGKRVISLQYPVHVFSGPDRAENSTLLQALFTALSWVPARILTLKGKGSFLDDSMINNENRSVSLSVVCKDEEDILRWRLGREKGKRTSALSELNIYAKKIQEAIATTRETVNLPIFVYYPNDRARPKGKENKKTNHRFSLVSVYAKEEVFNPDGTLSTTWFCDQQALDNQNRLERRRDDQEMLQQERNFSIVKKAIETCVPSLTDIWFDWSPPQGIKVKRENQTLRMEQLSPGEQALIMLTLGIARKLTIANPCRENPLQGEGIVLIDVGELQLSSSQQGTVLPNLVKTFPRCQFIVTTISPYVTASTPKDTG